MYNQNQNQTGFWPGPQNNQPLAGQDPLRGPFQGSIAQERPRPIFTDFDPTSAATHPADKIIVPEHTFVIDSRQRDTKRYPSPSYYTVDLGIVYKNITSIELRGSVIPRSSYNVHNLNESIDFSIGSSVTALVIENGGSGYVSPVINISSPSVGTQATATLLTNSNGTIVSTIIVIAGTGYRSSVPPIVTVTGLNGTGNGAEIRPIIGTHYTAVLRHGQYTIGGNPVPPLVRPSNLVLEIQNALNYAANDPAPYNPSSTGPFEVRLVSQYPELTALPGTPEDYDTNSAQFNRINIVNVNGDHWELLFGSGPNRGSSAAILMGYDSIDYYKPVMTLPVITGLGTLISGGTTLRASNDYDLLDDPKYVMLSFWAGSDSFERLQCKDSSIDRKFGTMIFDANNSNVITDTVGNTTYTDGSGTEYLIGDVAKGPFWTSPGMLKPIRGFDFDQKKLEFSPAIGKLSSLTIEFTIFGSSGANKEYYNFQNRNHLLVFSVKANDNKSGQTA
jgi:hypothetical protein